MKKIVLFFISVLLTFALIAGCSSGTSSSGGGNDLSGGDSSSATAETDGGQAKDVVLTAALSMDLQELFEEFMADFESKNPGIKIDLLPIEAAIAEFVQPAIASNTMPDILSVNSDSYSRKLADEGWLMDLSGTKCEELISDTIIPYFISDTGIFYGLPYGIATILIYYNTEIFSECGITEVPTDWDAFLEVCATIKANGFTPMSISTDSAGNTMWSLAFANNIIPGNSIWEQQMNDGSFNFNIPGVVDILDKLKLLYDNGYFQEGSVNSNYQQSIDIFNQGLTAMYFNGSWFAASVDGVADFEVGAFIPPYNAPGANQYVMVGPETGWGGSAKTDHPEEVIALLTHFLDGGRNILQNGRGNIPITKDTSGSLLPPSLDAVVSSIMNSSHSAPLYYVYMPTVFQTELEKISQDVMLGTFTTEEACVEIQNLYDQSFN